MINNIIIALSEYSIWTVLLIFFLVLLFIIGCKKIYADIRDMIIEKPLQEHAVELWKQDIETKLDDLKITSEENKKQSILHDEELRQQMNKIDVTVSDMSELIVDMKIDLIRSQILDFETRLLNGQSASKEKFDNVFDIFEHYEEILTKYNRENGQVKLAMELIEIKYKEMWSKGKFTGTK